MIQFHPHTTNPTTVEVGVLYWRYPQDFRGDGSPWIPEGYVDIEATVDSVAFDEDQYGTTDEVAEQWFEQSGIPGTFCQSIMEP